MQKKLFTRAVLAGMIIAMAAYAQEHKETILYSGNTSGSIESSSWTFPEQPEWSANWGNFENMVPPYVRISGQKNSTGDWTGALSFASMPVDFQNGTLSLKVRATQNVKFGVWATGSFGTSKIHYENLTANSTKSISFPLAESGNSSSKLEKIWIGLFNVKAYQYTTLFVDDVKLSYSTPQNVSLVENIGDYTFNQVDPSSPIRESLWGSSPLPPTSPNYDTQKRVQLKAASTTNYLISETEYIQITNILQNDSISPKKSRENWYRVLFLVDRNRLKDSVTANPKQLYLDASSMAASYDMQKIPLLVADLDYNYKLCKDSLCKNTEIKQSHLLFAGLSSSYTHSSKVHFVYDPFFVVTSQKTIPQMELCYNGSCKSVIAGSEAELEFSMAGIHKITVKLHSGSFSTQQTLSLEVK